MSEILRLHKKLKDKEISAKELTNVYLKALKRDNPALNAFVNITEKEAIESSALLDKKISQGMDFELLAGVPMSLKDNISTKGIETTCCSSVLKGYTPVYDATVWQRLKEKGAVLLGKTNMDEFAMGSTCETSFIGGCSNPFNRDFVAGGSSGGSAACVSANLSLYSIGSDTGGSVRQPASFCGCVGLKPTYGSISRYGLIAFASSLDTVGIMAGSVEDTSLVFDCVRGYDKMDSTSEDRKVEALRLNGDIRGKRIGVPKELMDRAEPQVREAVENACSAFESMGVEVELFSMPHLISSLPAYYIIACAEASSNLGRYDSVRYGNRADDYETIHQLMCKTRGELFGSEVKKRILLGTYVLSAGYYDKYYAKAQNLRKVLKGEFNKAFQRYDALLTPTALCSPYKKGELSKDKVASFNADLCTVQANLAGIPALSLPCSVDSKGLPIGVQLMGDKFREDVILNLANKLEEALDLKLNCGLGVRI
ncbi:MAG: Asp-tRNA(Asn)/Glu-tRNA(Gln) amidotransferase subunit GatA [Clostridia bacterium]|nr:Asp-tRNA(Asn)/Glu-tRNA(Gln) amidotransferase subunit GatA [Clostridia bacterium]